MITTAVSQTCANTRSYTQCTGTACWDVVGSRETTTRNVVTAVTNSPTARALAKALSTLKNKCKCAGSCWCSNGDR